MKIPKGSERIRQQTSQSTAGLEVSFYFLGVRHRSPVESLPRRVTHLQQQRRLCSQLLQQYLSHARFGAAGNLPRCSTELHPTPQAQRRYGEHQQHSCHSQCWEEPMKDSVRNTRFTLLSTGIVLRSALQTHEAAVARTASRGEALTLGLGGNAPALWRQTLKGSGRCIAEAHEARQGPCGMHFRPHGRAVQMQILGCSTRIQVTIAQLRLSENHIASTATKVSS